MKNYYKILEINEGASEKEIKTAFYRLAKKYHPDFGNKNIVKNKFEEIKEAYEILKDNKKRKQIRKEAKKIKEKFFIRKYPEKTSEKKIDGYTDFFENNREILNNFNKKLFISAGFKIFMYVFVFTFIAAILSVFLKIRDNIVFIIAAGVLGCVSGILKNIKIESFIKKSEMRVLYVLVRNMLIILSIGYLIWTLIYSF